MKKNILIFIGIIIMITTLNAQENITPFEKGSNNEIISLNTKHNFDMGFGLGCDYSGLGLKLSYQPVPSISTFISTGFAFVEIGWNVGISYHLISKTKTPAITPHVKVMYGYNEIIWLFDTKKYNDLYYGYTTGIGFEYRFGQHKKHRVDFDINFPFRSQKYKDDFQLINEDPNVSIKKPLPFAFAVGYHWNIF